MKKSDLYCGGFLAAGGVFVVFHALHLGMGNPQNPGPGFFPLIVGFFLLFFSGLIVLLGLRERNPDVHYNEWPSFHGNVFWSLGLLFVYSLFLLESLGFILSGFALLLYFYKISSGKNWWVSTFYAALIVSVSYYFFGVLLEAQFPKGIFAIG
jgi:putative tricarboxylic transport membrane protein